MRRSFIIISIIFQSCLSGKPANPCRLVKRRIRLAGILLRDTASRIQEAAEQRGFLDINYFNRLFKRHYGKTPRDFRRELHKPRS
ncbi:MAG: helix-turn-helix domain-containing protein [Treponema sp.]|nr:helix-turn-helix domain-containing protein [Treponema sp.]